MIEPAACEATWDSIRFVFDMPGMATDVNVPRLFCSVKERSLTCCSWSCTVCASARACSSWPFADCAFWRASSVDAANPLTVARASETESTARESCAAEPFCAVLRFCSASATLSLSVSATTELTVETNWLLMVSSRVVEPASVTFGDTGFFFSLT